MLIKKMPETLPSKRPTGRPTSGRAAQIADDVVQATLYEFSQRGANFSMDEVAKRAAVSKQAIYRRWSSKLELLVYAVDQSLLDFVAETDGDRHPEALDALEAFAWKIFNTDASTHRLSIFLQVEALHVQALRVAMLKWREQMNSAIIVHLDTLADLGHLAEADKALYANMLMDILSGASTKLAMIGEMNPEQRREYFGHLWHAFRRMIMQ